MNGILKEKTIIVKQTCPFIAYSEINSKDKEEFGFF